MKYTTAITLALLFFCCSEPVHPVEQAVNAYMAETLDDPASYEFVSLDRATPVYVKYPAFVETFMAAPFNRRGAVRDSMYALTSGDVGYYDAFVTFRAKNRMGALVKERIYVQVGGGKVHAAKKWNEGLPEDIR